MQITNFTDLHRAAGLQARPQRMLFVFLRTCSQKDYTAEERAGFEAGEGGALEPLFCVDLSPSEMKDFRHLVSQADQQRKDWDKVLVACMDEPSPTELTDTIELALKSLVAKVQAGEDLSAYLCFTRDERLIQFRS